MKQYKLPWKHETDGKKMSAVVDADGTCIAGSLICQQADTRDIKAHALIVKAVNNYPCGYCGRINADGDRG